MHLLSFTYAQHKEPQIRSRVRTNEYKNKQELQKLCFALLSMKFLVSFKVSNAFQQRMKTLLLYECSIRNTND